MTCNEEGSLALHLVLSITEGGEPARRAADAGRVACPRQSMGPNRYEHGQQSIKKMVTVAPQDIDGCEGTSKSPWQEELFEQLGKKAELRREGPSAGSEALVLPGHDGERGLWT